jgi:hypothetical protein
MIIVAKPTPSPVAFKATSQARHGETSFVCPICEKEYCVQENLYKHIKERVGDTPYTCTVPGCEKSIISNASLHKHILYHIKFRWRKCDKFFDTCQKKKEHTADCPNYKCRQCVRFIPKNKDKTHNLQCDLRKPFDKRSGNGRHRMNTSKLVEATNQLTEYLENNKIEITGQAKRFRVLWNTQSPNLLFVDTVRG